MSYFTFKEEGVEQDFAKEFTQCPNCGSTRRFCEKLTLEARERNLARPEWTLYMDKREGPAFDLNRIILLPVGIKVPGFLILTDICMDCGTIYAVQLRRLEAQMRTQEIRGS